MYAKNFGLGTRLSFNALELIVRSRSLVITYFLFHLTMCVSNQVSFSLLADDSQSSVLYFFVPALKAFTKSICRWQ